MRLKLCRLDADDRTLSTGDGGRRSSGSSAIAAERSIGLHWFSAACGERLLETARLPWEEPRLRGRPGASPAWSDEAGRDPGLRYSRDPGLRYSRDPGLERVARASLAVHGLEPGGLAAGGGGLAVGGKPNGCAG